MKTKSINSSVPGKLQQPPAKPISQAEQESVFQVIKRGTSLTCFSLFGKVVESRETVKRSRASSCLSVIIKLINEVHL